MLLSSPIVHYSSSFGLLWVQLGNAARAIVDYWDDHITQKLMQVKMSMADELLAQAVQFEIIGGHLYECRP